MPNTKEKLEALRNQYLDNIVVALEQSYDDVEPPDREKIRTAVEMVQAVSLALERVEKRPKPAGQRDPSAARPKKGEQADPLKDFRLKR